MAPFLNEKIENPPFVLFFLGTVFPDVFDKTLFYSLKTLKDFQLIESGFLDFITSTRTFTHSFVFILGFFVLSFLTKNQKLYVFLLGCVSHIFLDHFSEQMVAGIQSGVREWNVYEKMRIQGFLWPFLGNIFPYFPHSNATEHLFSLTQKTHILFFEALGTYFLWKDFYPSFKVRIQSKFPGFVKNQKV